MPICCIIDKCDNRYVTTYRYVLKVKGIRNMEDATVLYEDSRLSRRPTDLTLQPTLRPSYDSSRTLQSRKLATSREIVNIHKTYNRVLRPKRELLLSAT